MSGGGALIFPLFLFSSISSIFHFLSISSPLLLNFPLSLFLSLLHRLGHLCSHAPLSYSTSFSICIKRVALFFCTAWVYYFSSPSLTGNVLGLVTAIFEHHWKCVEFSYCAIYLCVCMANQQLANTSVVDNIMWMFKVLRLILVCPRYRWGVL